MENQFAGSPGEIGQLVVRLHFGDGTSPRLPSQWSPIGLRFDLESPRASAGAWIPPFGLVDRFSVPEIASSGSRYDIDVSGAAVLPNESASAEALEQRMPDSAIIAMSPDIKRALLKALGLSAPNDMAGTSGDRIAFEQAVRVMVSASSTPVPLEGMYCDLHPSQRMPCYLGGH